MVLCLVLLSSCAKNKDYPEKTEIKDYPEKTEIKDYPEKTEYYNFINQTGPTSVDAAISLLSKKSNLDNIEGVWISEVNFTIAIIQEGRNYSSYRVASPYYKNFGYKDGTIFKGASKTTFNAQEAVASDDLKVSCVAPAKYVLQNVQTLKIIDNYCGIGQVTFNLLWPENRKVVKKETKDDKEKNGIIKSQNIKLAEITCNEIGFKSTDDDFKICVLTVLEIGDQQKIDSKASLERAAQMRALTYNTEKLKKLERAENRRVRNKQLKVACRLLGTC